MIDTVLGWVFDVIAWLWHHWYLVAGLFVVGLILETVFPCIWGHAPDPKVRVLYDSPNVRTSTIDYFCKRCKKKC